jgi:Txe/YoeB family toxin of Txe-Axe toxin-antitoxin module
LCNPLNAEDFEQETDGDTLNMINKLVERAQRVPWNIFVLTIDKPEDFMKMKREKLNSSGV